jgi:hypothetical protein
VGSNSITFYKFRESVALCNSCNGSPKQDDLINLSIKESRLKKELFSELPPYVEYLGQLAACRILGPVGREFQ